MGYRICPKTSSVNLNKRACTVCITFLLSYLAANNLSNLTEALCTLSRRLSLCLNFVPKLFVNILGGNLLSFSFIALIVLA